MTLKDIHVTTVTGEAIIRHSHDIRRPSYDIKEGILMQKEFSSQRHSYDVGRYFLA